MEVGLIDANKLKKVFEKWWDEMELDSIKACILELNEQPTIDPETLPIVRELRANIAIQEKIIKSHHNPHDTDQIVKLSLENSNLKKQLAEVTSEMNSLRIFYNDIVSNPDCNTCKNKNCEYRPKSGDITRFNCPLWEGEKEKNERVHR